jgi:hypothetical protein
MVLFGGDSGSPSMSNNASLRAYAGFLDNSLPSSLSPSEESQAMSFFFRNFVLVPREADSTRGFLELLAPVYNNAPAASALHDATHAVALSALGAFPDRMALRQEARVVYGQALQKINSALRDPVAAKSDETLLAILLFSMYEVSRLDTCQIETPSNCKRCTNM